MRPGDGMPSLRATVAFIFMALGIWVDAQQTTGQDLEKLLERADKIVEEAKTVYETGRTTSSIEALLTAAFKLEEARIKYLVAQELGDAAKQKVAAERLRAINQLNKLVNDAKVAITPRPADPSALPPVVVPPQPAPPAVNPAPGAAKRAPIPEAAKQREAEKLIKDIFKEQYSKRAPADRKALARLLLGQVEKNQDDLAALWVICREAQDAAVQACDIRTAVDAVESAARVFEVDAAAMKNDAFVSLGKLVKTPEEFVALTTALHELVEELVEADQHEAAEKAANLALQQARRSKDDALFNRASNRTKEVADGKSLFAAMKSSREALAKNADDPRANLEMGQFQCFVKGNWDVGLRFLSKGSDATLKALAEKELARPAQAAELVALAESWEQLADKDKSALRKSQLLAHARSIYEGAMPNASGLLRAKVEKRLKDMERLPGLVILEAKNSKLGWTGLTSKDNEYQFDISKAAAQGTLHFWIAADGGTDSNGDVLLVTTTGQAQVVHSWKSGTIPGVPPPIQDHENKAREFQVDIGSHLSKPGRYTVRFKYTSGVHALVIYKVQIAQR